jgi:hypothetical protein
MFELLAQADADDAFRDFSTLDELMALPACSNELRRIYWKDKVLKKYVLQNGDGNALTTQVFSKDFSRYVAEEGYDRVTSYGIRRFVSNKLASELIDIIYVEDCTDYRAEHVPDTDLTQIMGHADDNGKTFGKYYRSKLSTVDIQGILIDGEEEEIDWDQYMRPERVEDLPGTLPLSTLREIEQQVSAVESVQERYQFRKTLRNEALEGLNSSDRLESQSPCSSPRLIDSMEQVGDLRLRETIDQIAGDRFLPDASLILDAWDMPDFDIRTNGLPALKALSRILRSRANGEPLVYYYPDEYPIRTDSGSLVCGECERLLDG